MNDAELTRALERGEIDNEAFHHASHLRVAWVYLSESGSVDEAADKMRDTLRRFAASAGKLEKYHETITLFGCAFLVEPTRPTRSKPWKNLFRRIRSCWKNASHSLTIRRSGFLVIMPGPPGWNLT